MPNLNHCTFIGHLGRDPEVKHTTSGDTVANFSIAVSEKWKDKTSGEQQERTEWVRCVAWRKIGEICGEYLKKGAAVYISGKMQTRKWQDKEGNDKYTTEIMVEQMQMLSSKRDAGEDREEASEPKAATKPKGKPGGFDDLDDDIPF